MSAAAEHQDAQRATMAAKDALAALNARIASGDTKVTGSALGAAEAQVTLAERLEIGALARAEEEQEAAAAAAKDQAIDALLASYENTSSALTNAIEKTLTSLSDLLAAAQTHQANTQWGLSAAGLNPIGGAVPGFGRLQTPSPEDVIGGVLALSVQSFGMRPTAPHPHRLIEPIAPFLKQEVRA